MATSSVCWSLLESPADTFVQAGRRQKPHVSGWNFDDNNYHQNSKFIIIISHTFGNINISCLLCLVMLEIAVLEIDSCRTAVGKKQI